MKGLSLEEEVPGLSLSEDDDEAPGLSLDDEPEEKRLTLTIKLRGGSPQSLVPMEELLGKVVEGFKVVQVDDVWPKTGEDWNRELIMVQQQ